MKVQYSFLKDYLSTDLSQVKLTDVFTKVGFELKRTDDPEGEISVVVCDDAGTTIYDTIHYILKLLGVNFSCNFHRCR